MNTSTSHPTDQALRACGLGRLDGVPAASVHSHLEGCPECRRHVAELSSDSFLGRLRDAKAGSQSSGPAVSSTDGLSMLDGRPAPAAPPPASTLPPGLADHPDYKILRELGHGGMGTVFLARNTLMGRMEVLKVISGHLVKRRGVIGRFLGEIRSAAKLLHPHIVAAYTAIRLSEGLVLAMEYVEGLDLSRVVKAKGPLPVAHACSYVHQAALGLQHAHEHGMVHRDTKPSNLMLAKQGTRGVVKVLDFGLAKLTSEGAVDGGLTHEGQMLGTPDFIAPEQIRNAREADIRADIYSPGCTLYYLLTGKPPFQGDSLYDILQAHHSMDATPLNLLRPKVPVEVAAIVAKMMAKEPGRRFQEPKEVAQALKPYFKSSVAGGSALQANVSPTTQAGAERTIGNVASISDRPHGSGTSPPLPPTMRTTGPAPRPESMWQSLIETGEAEPLMDQMPAASRNRKPPWLWPSAAVASLFGLIALGAIIITIRDKSGREINRIVAPDDSTVLFEDSRKKIEIKTSETGRDDAAGRGGPVPPAGAAGSPPVSKPKASSTDPFQADTFWWGTSTVLFRSWTNDVAKPRALWLTIKARSGTQFKAVAESPRGAHDAEGTFKDGVIEWKVAKESFSWQGKLAGKELAGTFRGTTWQGDLSSEFRLALADDPPPRRNGLGFLPPDRHAALVGSWATRRPPKATSSSRQA
jgi:serine/threonine protein kinase